MTVALNVKGKDFIIMAIDRRASWKNSSIHNDQCNKMFILPNQAAISFSGSLTRIVVNKETNEVISRYMDVNDLIYGLMHYPESEKMTINDTIEYVIRKFCSYFKEFTTQIHLAGCENGNLVLLSLEFHQGELVASYPIPADELGFRFSGSDPAQILKQMIKVSRQPPTITKDALASVLVRKSDRELIEFAVQVIEGVMHENRTKRKEHQTVGGDIDIVRITKEETVLIKKLDAYRGNV